MPYGSIKVDNIVFTNGGSDQTITVSGLIASTSGNLTVTGTVQGGTIIGTSTISGATITGNTGQFTTLTGGTAGFTTVTGTTVTGTTANFASGVFTTQISGATVTGNVGSFATITGGVVTLTSGVFAAGSASAPSISFSSDSNTGIYSPGADQVAISTSGTQRLVVDASGRVGVASSASFSTFSYASGDRTPRFQVVGTSLDEAALAITRTNSAPSIFLGNGSSGSNTDASATLGRFVFAGFQTDKHYSGAEIQALAAGTPSQNSMPASLIFNTTPAASTTPVERLRITSAGLVGVGASSAPGDLNSRMWIDQAGTNDYGLLINASGGVKQPTLWFRDASGALPGKIVGQAGLQLATTSSATTALTIDASQRVGIGTTSATERLAVNGNIILGSDSQTVFTNNIAIFSSSADFSIKSGSANLLFKTGASNDERARIDTSGRLLVGTSSSRALATASAGTLQVEGTSAQVVSLTSNVSSVASSYLVFGKSRGTSLGAVTSVSAGDDLGGIYFAGADGASTVYGGAIVAQVDGTPGANDMPGRLVFSTTADGASSPTERMRISSAGAVTVGTTNNSPAFNNVQGIALDGANGIIASCRDGNSTATFGRKTNDGDIVEFFQDGTKEGTISVSGTTVSYNGAHLSRWSQLPNGAEREEILRGSVLSNIDEMCEWTDEENEQLNRMKLSDVEGDKNVSGVFQAWDDDDDTYTNDFYCAMTGDFIIRIGAGVTVERGDLLMSAGDGTAKPQDDDIIRSKTIAKVTSTNVSCTYDDGSYCVPCVLMAC